MLGLTLHRPWDTAILLLGKPVENRDWPPPASLIGQRFALHSGKQWDGHGAGMIVTLARATSVDEDVIHRAIQRAERLESAIIGTVKLGRVLRRGDLACQSDPLYASPWFFGDFGWVCDEPFMLPVPVPCRGAQKLWKLPPDIESYVQAQEVARVR